MRTHGLQRDGWRRWGGWSAVAAYAGFLAYMSLRAFGSSAIERAIDGIGRAYFHLPAYAGLALLLGLMLARIAMVKRTGLAFVAATAYGWLLELAQIPAPTRSFNLRGLLFDALGAATGAAALLLLAAAQRKSRRGARSAAATSTRRRA